MPSPRSLDQFTWQEIAALDKQRGVVILPIGATEQHGPHLPVCTDSLLVTGVLDAVLRALPDGVAAWSLPALPYGKSNEHAGFPGTLSLSAATLGAVLRDIAESVKDAGFRRLAFMNGHGGNVAVLDAAARDIRAATGLMTFCLHPALYVEPPFDITPEERRFGIHAGELETSLVLTFAPGLVHMDRAVCHFPRFPDAAPQLHLFGPAQAAWLTRDWSSSGVFGDATLATAEKGDALLARSVQRLARLIADISEFEVGYAA